MKKINIITIILTFLILIIPGSFALNQYNTQGNFIIKLDTLSGVTFNNNISSNFTIIIKNRLNEIQNFNINLPIKKGWNIISSVGNFFTLNPNQSKNITIYLKVNKQFDYRTNLISPDTIQISQQKNFAGIFIFPLAILGKKQNITFNYILNVEKKSISPINFKILFSNQNSISPKNPLTFSVGVNNINSLKNTQISVFFKNQLIKKFNSNFSQNIKYKIFNIPISTEINPQTNIVKVIIRSSNLNRSSITEWFSQKTYKINKFNKLIIINQTEKNIFSSKKIITIKNVGNVEENYSIYLPYNILNNFFLSTNIKAIQKGKLDIIKVNIPKNQNRTIEFEYNYLSLYLLLIVIILIILYFYFQAKTNPLNIKNKIYDVKREKLEGIKSAKIRIEFENIKERKIREMKLIFRIPRYLNIKDDSFLLSEPNQVLKGKTQYKLIWIFKNLEKNDTRVLGFSIANSKGILGDLILPKLEIEILNKGKNKRYYKNFRDVKS